MMRPISSCAACISLILAILCMAVPAGAQTKIQTIAEEIEADAKLENPRLGLDTLIRAAERLRGVDPATARHLLDTGVVWLDRFPPPSYFTYRFMITYAHIDLNAAEQAGTKIADKLWVYTALIEQSARAKDYTRVNRLVRRATENGVYSSGAVTFALQNMARNAPQDAIALLGERVADFPATAKASEVHLLLDALAVFSSPDAELTRMAVRKIFAAIDRPDFQETAAEYEDTATYNIRGKNIKTATTFETVLLPAAAYMALFDAEAFRERLASLPDWGPALADLTTSDLTRLARTSTTRVQQPSEQQPKPAPLPDVSKMSYEEAIASAHLLKFPANYFVLSRVAVRADFTADQRKAAFEEIFPLLRQADPLFRYQATNWIYSHAADSKIEGLFAEAALEWIGAIDAAVSSDDHSLLLYQERGEPHSELVKLDKLFQRRDFALSQPHPSMVSRRALARLDRAAGELSDFSLSSLDGPPFSLRELKGKIVLIDFWATWCPPCRDAVPALEKIHREWNSKGVVVLGVDDEPPAVIRSFTSKNGLTYPTLLDPDRKVHEVFGVDGNAQGIPLTVVFEREGKFVGAVPYPHTEENFLGLLKKAGL